MIRLFAVMPAGFPPASGQICVADVDVRVYVFKRESSRVEDAAIFEEDPSVLNESAYRLGGPEAPAVDGAAIVAIDGACHEAKLDHRLGDECTLAVPLAGWEVDSFFDVADS